MHGQQTLVQPDRLRVIADAAEDHRLEVLGNFGRFRREQRFDFLQRLGLPVAAIEHLRQVLARGVESWRARGNA